MGNERELPPPERGAIAAAGGTAITAAADLTDEEPARGVGLLDGHTPAVTGGR